MVLLFSQQITHRAKKIPVFPPPDRWLGTGNRSPTHQRFSFFHLCLEGLGRGTGLASHQIFPFFRLRIEGLERGTGIPFPRLLSEPMSFCVIISEASLPTRLVPKNDKSGNLEAAESKKRATKTALNDHFQRPSDLSFTHPKNPPRKGIHVTISILALIFLTGPLVSPLRIRAFFHKHPFRPQHQHKKILKDEEISIFFHRFAKNPSTLALWVFFKKTRTPTRRRLGTVEQESKFHRYY